MEKVKGAFVCKSNCTIIFFFFLREEKKLNKLKFLLKLKKAIKRIMKFNN